MNISKLRQDDFGAGKGSLLLFSVFSHLKRLLDLLVFVQRSPPPKFFDHWFDMITLVKKNTENQQIRTGDAFLVIKGGSYQWLLHPSPSCKGFEAYCVMFTLLKSGCILKNIL